MGDQGSAFEGGVIVCSILGCYLLPTINAFLRGHPSKWAIFIANLFFGWTGLMWIWIFIWSLTGHCRKSKRQVRREIRAEARIYAEELIKAKRELHHV